MKNLWDKGVSILFSICAIITAIHLFLKWVISIMFNGHHNGGGR
jgi:hypothetical protein